jgi:FkbM family methyltransferase
VRLLPARLNDKPHYVFHPLRTLRRARYRGPSGAGRQATARLPWGLALDVNAEESIGFTILTTGVFDPRVSETMYRLIDPGDFVVDVGANVGYLTSLAARRAGPGGEVLAFEPHPRVFELLRGNIARWADDGVAAVEARPTALSDRDGTAELNAGSAFDRNMGLAHVEVGSARTGDELIDVTLEKLDDVVGDRPVGLLKIDVEGHEPAVLRGAQELLRSGRVRDVIFEDHDPYPDASTEIVEGTGYTLYSLSNDLFGVLLGAPAERGEVAEWPGPSYLATRDPERARERLGPRGWRIPGIGPSAPWRMSR